MADNGPGGGYWGTCWSYGNIGIVSEKLQTFRSKERARREFAAKSEGVWAKNGGVWAKNAFCRLKANFRWQRKIHQQTVVQHERWQIDANFIFVE